MKKFILFFIVIYCSAAAGAETSFNIDTETSQQQFGGTQRMIFNSNPANEIIHRAYINAHTTTDPPFASRIIIAPKGSQTWVKKKFYLHQELDNIDEVLELIKRDGDIIQYTEKPIRIDYNTDTVYIVDQMPDGPNDIELWSLWLETPLNAHLDEGVRRLVSLAKAKTGTRRIFVSVEANYQSDNASGAVGNAAHAAIISGTTALANAFQPQIGKSSARGYKVWQIVVLCYNDSKKEIKKMKNDYLKPIFFNEDGLISGQENINLNTIFIKNRWSEIKRKKISIEFLGLYLPENSKMAKNAARVTMLEVGSTLYKGGIDEEEIEDVFRFNCLLSNEQQSNDLKNRGAVGAVVVKISKNGGTK